jgi:hypothetical protein
LFCFNAFYFVQEIEGLAWLDRLFHLLNKAHRLFVDSYSILQKGEAVIVVEVVPDDVLYFGGKFVLDNDLQLLLDQIINEIHALLNVVLVTAAFDLHHNVEKLVERCSVLGQYFLHIEALARV